MAGLPTPSPTLIPSESPSKNPTINPTLNPSFSPTIFPSQSPSASPSNSPTLNPTLSPTVEEEDLFSVEGILSLVEDNLLFVVTGVVLCVLVCCLTIATCCLCKRRKKKRRGLSNINFDDIKNTSFVDDNPVQLEPPESEEPTSGPIGGNTLGRAFNRGKKSIKIKQHKYQKDNVFEERDTFNSFGRRETNLSDERDTTVSNQRISPEFKLKDGDYVPTTRDTNITLDNIRPPSGPRPVELSMGSKGNKSKRPKLSKLNDDEY